jgi:hypothetical protein
MALQALWALAAIQFPDQFTIGRTFCTSDQLVARPLPKYRTTRTQNKQCEIATVQCEFLYIIYSNLVLYIGIYNIHKVHTGGFQFRIVVV